MTCADNRSESGLNRLAPCPDRPNCVSSLATDKQHGIAPLRYDGVDLKTAYDALLSVLNELPRMTALAREADFLHVTFKSRVFAFIDDVEFYFPSDAPVIHVRSASRTGYSDLGVNRKRVETLRRELANKLSPAE